MFENLVVAADKYVNKTKKCFPRMLGMFFRKLIIKYNRLIAIRKMSVRPEGTIAVCQMTSTSNRDENLSTCQDLIKRAKAAKASMVFLPEGCDYIASSHEESLSLAETDDGPYFRQFLQAAKEHNIWVSLGGIHFKSKSEGKLSNSSVLINSQGCVVARYDKTHLFDVDIPEKKVRLLESKYVEPGSNIVPPIDTPIGSVGLAICYDMRFPELSLTLRNMGAEILTFPSAFTFETGASHWQTLLSARAIETQCYVVAAAQCGSHNQKRRSWGHAMVVDPWGNVIAQCSDGTGIALASINTNYVADVRRSMPVLQHRRNDLYPAMPSPVKLQDVYQFGQVTVPKECVFYTSPLSIAFTNKRCVVPGHVLIAPIRQALRVADLTPAEIADMFLVAQKVEKVMETITGATSTTIVVQDGPEAGQTIRQVHIHILPRREGDFTRNDDIYDELHKHDKDEEKPWRSDEEMFKEATDIRKHFE